MLTKLWSWALSGMLLTAPVCLADHLPSELQARGTPERRLAGIRLDRSKVSDVIKMYGKPSRVVHHPKPPNLNTVDTYEYFWTKPGVELHLLVYRLGVTGGEYIALIEVEGSRASGTYGRTGKGLKLGDKLVDLRRLYGRRFKRDRLPTGEMYAVTVQWRSEEYDLGAWFDERGRITKLSLSAPE